MYVDKIPQLHTSMGKTMSGMPIHSTSQGIVDIIWIGIVIYYLYSTFNQ